MNNLPAKNFQVLTPHEFLEDIRLEAKNTKYRIWMQAMDISPGELTNQILNILEKKAIEGIDARLHIDYYSLLVTDGNFNYLMPILRTLKQDEKHKLLAKKSYFQRLEKSSVKILFTNPPGILEKIFPFKGRNHMKIVIADNNAWIGGVNFNDWNLNGNDFMVKLTEPKIVTHIVSLYKKIAREEQFEDYKIDCTPETSLLVDAGKIGKSIILDTALKLIQEAEHSVFMTTAFFPDTTMVRNYYNSPI